MRRHRFYILILLFCFGFVSYAQETTEVAAPEQDISVRENLAEQNKVELYPNPAVDYLVVHLSNPDQENVKFEIRSLLGTEMIVTPEILGDGRYRFPVKDFATGYYFVVIEDENFKIAQRFLKR